MSNPTETAPLWVIAVCALIWTLRMMFTAWLTWLARRYEHQRTPRWVAWIGALVSGGRFYRLKD